MRTNLAQLERQLKEKRNGIPNFRSVEVILIIIFASLPFISAVLAYRYKYIYMGWVFGILTFAETFLVAIAGARVVGSIHIHWEPDRDEAHFGMLSVDPRRQRQGIGRRLVAAAEEFALHKLRRRLLSMPILTTRPDLLPWYAYADVERLL
jgi:GNAT superfamily N-acetyltransferase